MKIQSLIISIIFALLTATQTYAVTGHKINWLSYDQGINLAKDEGKKVFLYFHADWCKYCVKMGETTFIDKEVVNLLNSKFVPIKVDADNEQLIAAKYGVKGLPNSWFLFKDAKPISRLPGFVDSRLFHTILKYIETDSFQKMTLEEFAKF